MLTLKDLTFTLNKNTQFQRHIIHNLNLHVKPGEFVTIIGGNGAGKSTLFNLISGALLSNSGKILLNQNNITLQSQKTRATSVAMVMQDPRIGTMENMTILENMAFAYKRGVVRSFFPFSNHQRKQFFKQKLSMLNMGLENRMNDQVTHLSGGQRQALSLILAVLADSKILLLDEITAALDPKMAETVIKIAYQIAQAEKRTCLMITHNMSHAIQYSDRILVLKEGQFTKEITPRTMPSLTSLDLTKLFCEN